MTTQLALLEVESFATTRSAVARPGAVRRPDAPGAVAARATSLPSAGRRPRLAVRRSPAVAVSAAEAPYNGRAGDLAAEVDPNEFRVDERTREVGRAGIAAARQALAEAARRSEAREQAAAVGRAPEVGRRAAA